MKFTYDASCGAFIGSDRDSNEDNFYFDKRHLPVPNKGLKNPLTCSGATNDAVLFAVFDGVGGEHYGEEAARLASEVFGDVYKQTTELAVSGKAFLYEACEKANAAVNALRHEKQVNTMGTTAAAVYLSQNEVVACNVGDSKIFRIRDGQMMQISENHTDEKLLLSMGLHKKPVLLQYIGIPDTEMSIEPYITKGEMLPGDSYVLCTDGVTDVLDVQEIYDKVNHFSAEDAVRQILALVNQKNGEDNATIIVIKVMG